jgi:hypothetical protein
VPTERALKLRATLEARGFVRVSDASRMDANGQRIVFDIETRQRFDSVKRFMTAAACLDLMVGYLTSDWDTEEYWVPGWLVSIVPAFHQLSNEVWHLRGGIISHRQLFELCRGNEELCASVASAFALGGSDAVTVLLLPRLIESLKR